MMRFPACQGFVAACILFLGLTDATRAQERQPARTDQQKDLDRQIYTLLKNVINKGADLYTMEGDRAGCYRLYEGSLMTLRPLLAHHPDLQKAIDASFAKAEQEKLVGNRAFALREALDKLRTELKPAQAQKTAPAAAQPNTPTTLWQRLGGAQNVTRVVDDFVDRAAKDPKVNFDRNGKYKFDAAKLADLKKKLVAMVSEASGGPLKYTGKSMKEVHKGMGITDAEFDALAAHLKKALEDHGARPPDVAAVLKAVGDTRADIVERR
jgi:hemoglobin